MRIHLLFGLLLCAGHSFADDDADCDILLKPRPSISAARKKAEAFEVTFAFGSVKYGLTASIRPDDSVLLQLVTHGEFDREVENAFLTSVERELAVVLRGQRTKTAELGPRPRDMTIAKLKRVRETLNGVFIAPEKVEPSLSARARSERGLALRMIILEFLGRTSGHGTDAFADSINTIHKVFIQSMSPQESTYFDYRIFDPEPGYQAERKGRSVDRAWSELGAGERANYEKVHDTLRQRLLEIARPYDKFRDLEAEQRAVTEKACRYMRDWHTERGLEPPSPFDLLYNENLALDEQIGLICWSAGQPFAPLLTPKEKELIGATFEYKAPENRGWWKSNLNPYVSETGEAHYLPSVPTFRKLSGTTTKKEPDRALEEFRARGDVDLGQAAGSTRDAFFDAPESTADSDAPIDDEIRDEDLVRALHAHGIHRLFDITRYSARDYLERFDFALPDFERLLDELNVLGIHLHFDAEWDRENHRIRSARREYFEYKHVPSTLVRWD